MMSVTFFFFFYDSPYSVPKILFVFSRLQTIVSTVSRHRISTVAADFSPDGKLYLKKYVCVSAGISV